MVVLEEDESILVKAMQDFTDAAGSKKLSGSTWLVKGPTEFIPSIEI